MNYQSVNIVYLTRTFFFLFFLSRSFNTAIETCDKVNDIDTLVVRLILIYYILSIPIYTVYEIPLAWIITSTIKLLLGELLLAPLFPCQGWHFQSLKVFVAVAFFSSTFLVFLHLAVEIIGS